MGISVKLGLSDVGNCARLGLSDGGADGLIGDLNLLGRPVGWAVSLVGS